MKSKKLSLMASVLILPCVISAGFFVPSAGAHTREFEDNYCKRRLAGTMSYETCVVECPGGAKTCRISRTFKAKYNDELDEDLDCYGCATEETCYDYGLMYGLDCIPCERDPKKKCVKEITPAVPFGIGPGALPLPKDPDGYQCWDCIDRRNECAIHFGPGVTDKPDCLNACKGKKDHKCVFKGIAPVDRTRCYECKFIPPPPVEQCKDIGFISKKDCAKCVDPNPICAKAFIWTKSGEMCYDCQPNFKTKSCEDQGLQTKCATDERCEIKIAPNLKKCCECVKKKTKCKDFGLQDPPGKCKKDQRVVNTYRSTDDFKLIECAFCVQKDCYPDLNKSQCEECEKKGGVCRARTTVRGGLECYTCVMPEEEQEKKTCEDLGYKDSCSPNPCDKNEKCVPFSLGTVDGQEISCADCETEEAREDPQCSERKLQTSCAECYQAQHGCKQIKISDDPEKWCAKCYRTEDRDTCAEYEMGVGGCDPNPCSKGYECQAYTKKKASCHACYPAKEDVFCEKYGALTLEQCQAQCKGKYQKCLFRMGESDSSGKEWNCYTCEKNGYCQEEGYISGEDCLACREKGGTCHSGPVINGQYCYTCQTAEENFCAADGAMTLPQCEKVCTGDHQKCFFRSGMSDSSGTEWACYICKPSGWCKEKGYIPGEECPACRERGGTCASAGNINGQYCYTCEENLSCGDYGLVDNCSYCNETDACRRVMAGRQAGETNDMMECAECVRQHSCAEVELREDCSSCSENEECHKVMTRLNNSEKDCWECRPKQEDPNEQCSRYEAVDSCSACKENENCVRARLLNDLNCFYCEPKGGCLEINLVPEENCSNCVEVGMECEATVTAPNGEQCFDCVEKDMPGCLDTDGMSFDSCAVTCEAPGSCQPGDTAPNGELCYTCVNPLQGKCDASKGEFSSTDCDGLCLDHETCFRSIMNELDGTRQDCFKCVEKLEHDKCGQRELAAGACWDGACSEGQRCKRETVDGAVCHGCEEIQTCTSMGLYDGDNCVRNCKNDDGSTGRCQQLKQDDNGVWCWECLKSGQEDACQASEGWGAGRCAPGKCKYGEACTEGKTWTGLDCYRCHAEDQTVCPHGWNDGTCTTASMSGQMIGFGQTCIDREGPCWKIVSIDSGMCEDPLKRGQCPQECLDGHYCQTLGEYCYWCPEGEDPAKVCYNMQQRDGSCQPDSCGEGTECQEFDYDGIKCHWCQIKAPTDCSRRELLDGPCSGDACAETQKCVQAAVDDAVCHTCEAKQTCADKGFFRARGCQSNCGVKTGCIHSGADDFGKDCFRCPPTEGFQNMCGTEHPGSTTDSLCLNRCEKDQCKRVGEVEHQFAQVSIDMGFGQKSSGGVRSKMIPCYACEGEYEPRKCTDGLLEGPCPGKCGYDKRCLPAGENCHTCAEHSNCSAQGFKDGGCPAECQIDDNHFCEEFPARPLRLRLNLGLRGSGSSGEGEKCHRCRTEGIGCFEGWSEGQCSEGTCPSGHICISEGNCYQCRPRDIQKNPCEQVRSRPGSCPQPCRRHEQCVDIKADGESCHYCAYWEDLDDDCWEFDAYVGRCPGECNTVTQTCQETNVHGTPCYNCYLKDNISFCSDGGIRGACHGVCTEKQLCFQRGSLSGPCHMCMDVERIEITYIIIIIETPFGRLVLDQAGFDPASLTGFSSNSVMALAKVDNTQLQKLQQLANLAKGGFTIGTAKEIAGMITDKLANKHARFNDACFDNLSARNIGKDVPETPEKSKGKKKKSKKKKGSVPEAPEEDVPFGKDFEKHVDVNGPVLACGQIDGEDSLAVFDANGSLVQNILKDDLVQNPGILNEALSKAEQSVQLVKQFQNMTPQSLFQKVSSTLVQKIMKPRESERDWKKTQKELKKRKKKQKEVVEPNDPFYSYSEKRKKKLLGILGSSKKMPKISMGLSLKMPGSTASMESRKKKNEEPPDQWGLHEIGYTPISQGNSAWNIEDGSEKNVLVAVVDSGLDMGHPDGPEYIWTNPQEVPDNGVDDDFNGYVDDVHGWNFLDNNNDLRDFKGHGTFVTGIIAAKRDNGIGIAGINPGAVIMPLKVVNKEGETNSLNIYRAIRYAVDKGARVINVSLGGRGISKLEQAALNYAHQRGALVLVASGNTGEYVGDVGPASAQHVVTVGATDLTGVRSTISSYGPNNAILAPGDSIYSLRSVDSFHRRSAGKESFEKLYDTQSGTSFSAPMVTGTVSLMLAKDPSLTPAQVEDILLDTAVDFDEEGWDDVNGAGRLDAVAALNAVAQREMSPEQVPLRAVKITGFEMNEDNKKFDSVDVYATVRTPDLDYFVVEAGKGKRPGKFVEVAGPFRQQADHDYITRITKKQIRGSRDWVIRLRCVLKDGSELYARSALDLR